MRGCTIQPEMSTSTKAGAAEQAKELTPEDFLAISRALADPRRFEILQQIAGCGSTLCGDLHAQGCLSPATISHHLKELQEAGLVSVERIGRQMRLTLERPVWNAYLQYLQTI